MCRVFHCCARGSPLGCCIASRVGYSIATLRGAGHPALAVPLAVYFLWARHSFPLKWRFGWQTGLERLPPLPRSLGRRGAPLSGRHFAPTPSKSAMEHPPPESMLGVRRRYFTLNSKTLGLDASDHQLRKTPAPQQSRALI